MKEIKRYHGGMEMKTCHDIRKWTVCELCGGMGDKRHMIKVGKKEYSHGRCFIKVNGMKSFLALPAETHDCLTVSDICFAVMKRIIDARE